ncbi:MAG: HD-GYP domain-containing protein [Chloroflexi bacterium]|nr:HD-GYP domain-containing protein [Chloroflexota bacterium]
MADSSIRIWQPTDSSSEAAGLVNALVAALAERDRGTGAHAQRCSWYALRVAQEIGLNHEERSVVSVAALLHDIGKLAVPDQVLLKPGPLTPEEWTCMKEHPRAGVRILQHIPSVFSTLPAVLHHHEHFDGSGYPDGLAGEAIPAPSRILLVTDAFDAMTSDRPYRKAMSPEEAVEELKRNAGTQFDPDAVAAFLKVLAQPPLGDAGDAFRTCLRHPPEDLQE